MGANTEIQWATHTFNPWVGCQRVSPGCTNCYAEAYDKRVGGLPKGQRKDPEVAELRWGPTAPRVRTSAANWKKPLAWNEAAKKAGVRHRVFCASLADVFEDRPELRPWRVDLFKLIAKTPHLDWLLLTKRPGNVLDALSDAGADARENDADLRLWIGSWLDGAPPANVWLGTTVEDQQRANERIPELLSVPATVRFLSVEPLLERVNVRKALWPVHEQWPAKYDSPEAARAAGEGVTLHRQALISKQRADSLVSWVIIGGESGPNARPFNLDWARDLVAQCRAAGVAPFVKQLGAVPCRGQAEYDAAGSLVLRLRDPSGGDPNEWPEDLRVREFPR